MKLLVISPRIPAAHKKGDQVLSFNRISYLAQLHHVEALCFGNEKDDYSDKRALESLGVKVHLVKWKFTSALWECLCIMFKKTKPFQCAFYTSTKFRNAYRNIKNDFEPDAIYSVTVRVLDINLDLETRIYVDLVDSIGLNFERRVRASSGLKRYLLGIEQKRIKYFERKVASEATKSFVVSAVDSAYIGVKNVAVLPLGIDFTDFNRIYTERNDPVIIFSGNMNYRPNVDAVLWFVTNCWPQIKTEVPQVKLVIAGSNPAPGILKLRVDNSIQVTGRVNSIAALLNSSQVSVAPMQSGSGMQFKILEAMACGLPVITTTLGLGDIKAISNTEVLVGDTSNEIVELVLKLLINSELRSKIGDAGWRFVTRNHDWNLINHKFATICGFK